MNVTVEIDRRSDGTLRVFVQGGDRRTLFLIEAPPRIALTAFGSWLESDEGVERVAGVHRSAWPVRR